MALSRYRLGVLSAALAFAFPILAAAQSANMPRQGVFSIWGNGGLVAPSESAFSSTFGVSGGIDYFLTRALSFGLAAGGWRTNTDLGAHANDTYFDAVGTYNWDLGSFHPFLQGGLGAYREDFPEHSASTKFGGVVGGGLDYSIARAWAVEGALRYHIAESTSGLQGHFLELVAGFKFYF